MRIAIITETFPSISETFISNKVEQLCLRGHIVAVFCHKKNKKLYEQLFPDDADLKICVFNLMTLGLFIAAHPLAVLRSIKKGKELKQQLYQRFRICLINRFTPDIIHFEFSGVGIGYLNELSFLKAKKVVSCRGTAEKVKLLLYEERKIKFREILKQADAIHCVSADMADTILPYCDEQKKIFINFPSIDTGFFERRSGKTKGGDCKIILSIGRMIFAKGYTNGLHVMQLLKASGLAFNWIIVGNGIKEEELIFKIDQLGLSNEVLLAGPKTRDEVKKLMETADIFYLPSVYEGIANVVLEAMSMELPIVSTKSGGMQEVITHEKDGLLADIHDYRGHADFLLKLCTDEKLAKLLAENARKKAVDKFNIQLQTNRFEAVYHQLANTGSFPAKS